MNAISHQRDKLWTFLQTTTSGTYGFNEILFALWIMNTITAVHWVLTFDWPNKRAWYELCFVCSCVTQEGHVCLRRRVMTSTTFPAFNDWIEQPAREMTESLPILSAGPLAALQPSPKLNSLLSSKLTSAACLLNRAGAKQVSGKCLLPFDLVYCWHCCQAVSIPDLVLKL